MQVAGYGKRLLQTAHALAQIDVAAALAEVAANQGYVRPKLTTHIELDVRQGRHPVVENTLELERFVANDATLIGLDDRIHHHRPQHVRQIDLLAASRFDYVNGADRFVCFGRSGDNRSGGHLHAHQARTTNFMPDAARLW